jgi:hypothetical protein
MHKYCVKAVDWAGKNLGKVLVLCAQSTGLLKYLTSQAFFGHSLFAVYTQARSFFKQAFCQVFNLWLAGLCPVSTLPMTNTNLIKD